MFGNLHLIINSCSIHSIYTSHIFTSVGSRNLCSGKWLSIFRSRSIFPFFFFFYILRKEGITSIIRKSIETQWSFTQSLPIFLFRLNAWFFGLPCQTTSKEIYHCGNCRILHTQFILHMSNYKMCMKTPIKAHFLGNIIRL